MAGPLGLQGGLWHLQSLAASLPPAFPDTPGAKVPSFTGRLHCDPAQTAGGQAGIRISQCRNQTAFPSEGPAPHSLIEQQQMVNEPSSGPQVACTPSLPFQPYGSSCPSLQRRG